MPEAAIPIVRFNSGETTQDLDGRTDLDWYVASCEILENAIARPEGPATMRTGTWNVGTPRVPGGGDGTVKLLPFVVEVDPLVTYMVEITDQKMRFWYGMTRLPVMDPDTPSQRLEIAAPWLATDNLKTIKKLQSSDTMWIMHPLYPQQKLTRTGPVGGPYSFALNPVVQSDGPYYAQNATGTTLTAGSAGPGAGISLAASAPLFAATDVGRLFRMSADAASWGWGVITAFTDAQNVTVTINKAVPTAATTIWRLGLYSNRTGFPSCAWFHQERLYYGSRPASSFPRADGSVTEDFDNFAPDQVQSDGSTAVTDTSAVAYVVAADTVAVIRSGLSNRSMVVLTSSTEMEFGTWQDTSALTPSRPPIVRPASSEGAIDADGLVVHDNVLFINRYGRSLNEMAYDFAKNGLKTREISIRASHMGDRSPFLGGVWANRPWNLVWLWCEDGGLVACTYTPEQTIIAFTHHVLAGTFQNGLAEVETMAVMPGLKADEVWMCVQRTINGQDVRQLCTFADALHVGDPQDLACYLDQAVTASGSQPDANLTFVQNDDGTVGVTADADAFTDLAGKRLIAVQQDGRDVGGNIAWGRLQLDVTTVTDARHAVCTPRSSWLPPSLTLASGQWTVGMTSMSGLGHLEGETVGILADGAPLAPQQVVDGTIAFQVPVGIATAGLLYTMILQPRQQEGGARSGTAQTRITNIPNVGLNLVRSGPFRAGAPDNLFDHDVRMGSDEAGQAVPLRTLKRVIETTTSDDGRSPRWRVEATGPLPVTVSSAVPHQSVGESVP